MPSAKAAEFIKKITRFRQIVIFGTGKMGQQLAAILRNIPEVVPASFFFCNSVKDVKINGLPVFKPSIEHLEEDYVILVASSRANFLDISNTLQGISEPSRVIYLSACDMECLKTHAFSSMLEGIGIDPILLKSMTNDIISHVTMFESETYNGSIRRKLYDIALEQSANLVLDSMTDAKSFSDVWDYRHWILNQATLKGSFLEFGVADGATLDFFACKRPKEFFYGFDSFVGLPEFWKEGFDQGRFAQQRLPEVPPNVELVQGWFSDTIPQFNLKPESPASLISFMHIDCDLYSSTMDVLEGCLGGLRSGTVLAFDEYFNYPGWLNHEYKAWIEFSVTHNISYKYIAYVENSNQVALEITSINEYN